MLNKLLGRGENSPANSSPLRRISNNLNNVKSVDATIKVGSDSIDDVDKSTGISDLDKFQDSIGSWRSAVPGLVSEMDAEKCIVLDRKYNNVLVLAIPEFFASGARSSLLKKIKDKGLNVEAESTATKEQIEALVEANKTKQYSSSGFVVNDDDRSVTLYDDIVEGAFEIGASDVHFELNSIGKSNILLRLYGRMRQWKSYDYEILLKAVASGFNSKTKSGTATGPSWSPDRPLSTMTEHVIGETNVNGRFSTYPVITGLDVVVRLLESNPRDGTILTLEELGYAESQIRDQLIPALRKNSGLIALSGGTGSGKSTALKTAMNLLPNKDSLKRYSVEDPVEYIMPGVRQISVQRGVDDDDEEVRRKFIAALRQLVRMDPDVLMVGEIRDSETGSIVSEFVQTGHRVLTTVHGDGGIDVMSRMTGELIAIPAEIMSTRKFLTAVVYQKLLPKLCIECRVPAAQIMSAEKLSLIQKKFQIDSKSFYCSSENGCPECRIEGIDSGGTKGLTVAAEIIVPDSQLRGHIRDKNWVDAENVWRKSRKTGFSNPDMTGKTAFEHALYKASQGIIDPRDIESEFEAFDTYEIFEGME
ncbi:Type II/IV secretion system protein (plasmid) [Janthinobacterium sp. HH102]|uniref:GspE/PulE family protein n=1 Tax=Janthinobacterium sp. HH102 TaxID=1537274 RepID=UPI000892EBA3|nr:ATPase, T2SS/T4P/T4SS family [Janthinobacterium sp. HH102]QOU76429.1 Type II/IV secretion system protein [Janthinobacterium sp. HH102]